MLIVIDCFVSTPTFIYSLFIVTAIIRLFSPSLWWIEVHEYEVCRKVIQNWNGESIKWTGPASFQVVTLLSREIEEELSGFSLANQFVLIFAGNYFTHSPLLCWIDTDHYEMFLFIVNDTLVWMYTLILIEQHLLSYA